MAWVCSHSNHPENLRQHTRPGKHTKSELENTYLGKSTISTGPFSIVFCWFTRGYVSLKCKIVVAATMPSIMSHLCRTDGRPSRFWGLPKGMYTPRTGMIWSAIWWITRDGLWQPGWHWWNWWKTLLVVIGIPIRINEVRGPAFFKAYLRKGNIPWMGQRNPAPPKFMVEIGWNPVNHAWRWRPWSRLIITVHI